MDINRMMHEIWEKHIYWSLRKDEVRGIYMINDVTGVAFYANTVEDVIRKVWLSLYMGGTIR